MRVHLQGRSKASLQTAYHAAKKCARASSRDTSEDSDTAMASTQAIIKGRSHTIMTYMQPLTIGTHEYKGRSTGSNVHMDPVVSASGMCLLICFRGDQNLFSCIVSVTVSAMMTDSMMVIVP
jgi:hypothetical protein